jgi:predicted RNA-binding Zn-ribbon protein involved in translation (DUF1610 family)
MPEQKGLVGGSRKIKRLFADIEVTPNVALVWRAGFKIDVGYDAIMVERKVICIGLKWEGERKVRVLRWTKNQDDRPMLAEFAAVAEEADEIVWHFGDSFDGPWLRARMVLLKLPPVPIWKTIDTKQWASKYFYFNSNKLDYLSKAFGHGGKLKTDYDLWKDVFLKNSQAALDRMCRYCGVDVIKLEKVFHDLRRWMTPKTHVGVLAGGEKWSCPHCGSTNVRFSKFRVTSKGSRQFQMKCVDCGAYYTISEPAFKAYEKAKIQTLRGSAAKRDCRR